MNIFDELNTRGHDEDFTPAPARLATSDLPGSWGKLSEMASRAERGEDLWHPLDDCRHIAKPEDLDYAMKRCQVATMGNRTSPEFLARLARMNLQNAG